MSITITPVANTQSFGQWVGATNELIAAANLTITVAANASGDSTTGNAFVTGIVGANTLVATNVRGGNVSDSANLTITSNVSMTGANASITSNLVVQSANIVLKSNSSLTALSIAGGISSTSVNVGGDTLGVSSNVSFTGTQLLIPVGNTAQRPSATINGLFRYNSDMGLLEFYGGTWLQLTAAANGAIAAGLVSFANNANIVSNNVQAAILETYSKKVNLSGDVMSGQLTVNTNGLALPSTTSATVLHLGSDDGDTAALTIDSFGNNSVLYGRRADGVNSAKTAVQANDTLISLSGIGHDGNTYFASSDISLDLRAAENFTNTAHGTMFVFSTTGAGTVVKSQVLRVSSASINVGTILTTTANVNIGGSANVAAALNVVGQTSITGNLVTSGTANVAGALTVIGSANVGGTVVATTANVVGTANVGSLNVSGLTVLTGNVTLSANLTLTSGIISGNGTSVTSVNAAFLEGHNTAYFANAALLTTNLVATSVMGTGSATSSTFLRGDRVWTTYGNSALLSTGTTSDYLADTTSRVMQIDQVWSAAAEVTITFASTIGINMATFINGVVTMTGAATLGTPSNVKAGQSGYIRIIQDGTGGRTLAYASGWKFAGGSAPTLSTAAGAVDMLFYQAANSTFIVASLAKAFA